jgi:hypothetical protein
MAIDSPDDTKDLKSYAYNTFMSEHDAEYPYFFEFSQVFIDRCYLLSNLIIVVAVLQTIYLFAWLYFYFLYRKHIPTNQYPLQKWALFFPFVGTVQTVSYFLELITCPWIDEENTLNIIQQILNQVFSIITVILADSLLTSVFFLVSIGWGITVFSLKRD